MHDSALRAGCPKLHFNDRLLRFPGAAHGRGSHFPPPHRQHDAILSLPAGFQVKHVRIVDVDSPDRYMVLLDLDC